MTDRVVVVRDPITVVSVTAPGPQGAKGDTGPANSALDVVFIAAATLSGHRVVTPAGGTVGYADNTVLAHLGAPLWLTLGATTVGLDATARAAGSVTEPAWSWTPGPVYLGTSGQLTQTPPTAAGGAMFLVQLGYAISATEIVIDRQPSIRLT